MADTGAPLELGLVKGEKILVSVESMLPDIVVVSFEHGTKLFQGALLDATKRGLPCGVQIPEPVPDGDGGDKFASIGARFSYFQEKRALVTPAKIDLRRNINPPARYKNARPTVRLRPRQVLCSKCRSICNENSENVDVSRKRKFEETTPTRRSDRRCQTNAAKGQRNLFTENQIENTSRSNCAPEESAKVNPSLIPKLSRLRPSEMNGSGVLPEKGKPVSGGSRSSYWSKDEEDSPGKPEDGRDDSGKRNRSSEFSSNPSAAYCARPRRLSSSSVESAKVPDEEDKKTLAAADSTMRLRPTGGRVSRKKRSVGSMEDLWDESVFEDANRTARTTPVIKISFGTQGEGTVMKIPPKIQCSPFDREVDTDTEDTQDAGTELERDPLELPEPSPAVVDLTEIEENEERERCSEAVKHIGGKDASAKAAKRALKKAKKEARRKMMGGVSPARSPCNGSPRYNPTSSDPLSYHRRRHKVKHKKKHKEERKHKGQSQPEVNGAVQQPQQQQQQQQQQGIVGGVVSGGGEQQKWNVSLPGDSYTAIKEQCLKQKLSISLKRLNTNAYARCDYPVSNASSGCKSPGASSDELSEQEPEVDAGETAPDFPPPAHPLVMRLAATPVAHCLTATGRRMDVGDIVWGKIHGFPWWPGKVLSITVSCKEDGTSSGPQAHVAWYGSSTSSLMSCDQLSPFLETFKTRFNKKKRGPYKEAIRQAQTEARSQAPPDEADSVLKTIMLRIMPPEDAQKYNHIKRKSVAFLSNLFRTKKFAASGMRIEDEEMDRRAPARIETPAAAVISNAYHNNNAVTRIPSTLSVAAVDVVVACQPHPSPSHSILTLTPGRTRNIDQDMEALRLSRQDNPFLQVLASRESLVESIEESESDDAILMSQELGDADPLTLAQVHEHLVRSPPPATWPHTPMFHFPHQTNNCSSNNHNVHNNQGSQARLSDHQDHAKTPHFLLGKTQGPKSPGIRGVDAGVELSRSEPSSDTRDRHSHPFSLLNPTPIRSLSEVRRLHRSADDNVQLMSSE